MANFGFIITGKKIPAPAYLKMAHPIGPDGLGRTAHQQICAARSILLDMLAAGLSDNRATHTINLDRVILALRLAKNSKIGATAREALTRTLLTLEDVKDPLRRANLNVALDQFLIAEMRLGAILLADWDHREAA